MSINRFSCVGVIAVLTIIPTSFYGQSVSPLKRSATITAHSATIALSLTLPTNNFSSGQIGSVSLTVKNLSNNDISFPDEQRVCVHGEMGEAPTTLRQRQLTHKLLPGEKELRGGGYEPTIQPGSSFTRKFDLTKLYDLSKPGKYTIYKEVLDESASKDNAGVWVRSDTVRFEVH